MGTGFGGSLKSEGKHMLASGFAKAAFWGLVSLAAGIGGSPPKARAAEFATGDAARRPGAESPSQVVAPPGGDRALWEELPRIGVSKLFPLGVDRRDRFWVDSEEGYHYWTGQAWHRWQPNDVSRMWHDRQGHSPGRHSYTFETCIGGRMYFERYRPRRIYRLLDDSDNVELVCLMPEQADYRGCQIGPSGRVWRMSPDRVSLYAPPPRSEAIAQARELAGGLIDDRPEVCEAAAAKIIALGFDAIRGLEAARRPKLPELDAAIDGLVKRMLDAEEMFQHGPWKHWPRHSDVDVSGVYVAVTDHADNFYLISQTESLWFQQGELAGRFDHQAMPVQNFTFYGLAPGVVLCGEWAAEGQPPLVWNFHAKRIGGGIPRNIKRVAWIPDGLLEDTERLKGWLWMRGPFSELSASLADGWSPEEITARMAAPACRLDRAQPRYPVSSARPGEAVMARYADRTQVLRGGKLYEIDWRNGVMPVAGRVFVDSQRVYWLSDRRRVARYWPGPPGASPVPSGKPSDRFEVVPLCKSLAAQDRQGSVYVFRNEDQGDVSRWHDGRWQRVTEGLRPPDVQYGPECRAAEMFVDDLGRVHLWWQSRQTTIWTRVKGTQIDRFPTATEMLADSYRTGSRWFSINIAVLEDGLWLPDRCVRSGSRAIRHFDGKRWHEVVRDVDADRSAYVPPDFLGLFVLPDDRLAAWTWSGLRKIRLDIIDRTTHVAHTVPTLDGVSVHTPDGYCPAWPADGTPVPEEAVAVVTNHHGPRRAYAAADFNTYGARGCEERLANGLPPELADMQTLWRRLSGRLRQSKRSSGTCLAGARRWACGFAIPVDLSQTPAAGLADAFITVAAEDEIWVIGPRQKLNPYPGGRGGMMSHIGYDLVRWKPTPIEAAARWEVDGKRRVVQFAATSGGEQIDVSGYLWQVDDQPWRIWRSTRPLDLSFLPPAAKKLRVIAVSWDGRNLSEPIETAIPAETTRGTRGQAVNSE